MNTATSSSSPIFAESRDGPNLVVAGDQRLYLE
jgi:hypothetical protein